MLFKIFDYVCICAMKKKQNKDFSAYFLSILGISKLKITKMVTSVCQSRYTIGIIPKRNRLRLIVFC